MTELSTLPGGVFCITLSHSLDDPDVIEYYLEKYPTETEKCLPLALRDILSPAAEKIGLSPMKIPSARDTLEMLRLLWVVAKADVRYTLLPATTRGLAYLVPYILSFVRLDYPMDVSMTLLSGKTGPTNPNRIADYINSEGKDLLVNAVESGNMDTVRVLLLLGADKELRDNALHEAARQIPTILGVIDLLLTPTTITLPGGKTKEMDGADIDESEALGIAAACSNIDAMKFLISRGADVNYHPTNGSDAPLSRAADDGNVKSVRLLLDAHADLHADNEDALLAAAAYGRGGMIRFLLDAKADPRVGNAFFIASENGHPDAIKILAAAGADVHDNGDAALIAAVGENKVDAVRALLDLGANIDVITDEDVRGSDKELIDLFNERGRNIPYPSDDDYDDDNYVTYTHTPV